MKAPPPPPPRTHYMFWLAVIGFIFGLIGVAIATVIAVLAAGQPLTPENALRVHFTNPLLWLFDLLPFIMAIMLGLVGSREDRLRKAKYQIMVSTQRHNAEIEVIKVRSADLEKKRIQLAEREAESIKTEEAISRAKRQWESTFDSVQDMIILTNANRSIIRCNRAASQIFNLDYGEIVGRPISDFVPEGQLKTTPAIKGGTPAFTGLPPTEVRLPGLDGWYEVYTNPLDIEGGWAGEIYIIRDVTDRAQANLSLQLQKQYYESLVKNSPIAIVTLKMDQTVVECNPAFENLFGFSAQEIIGKELDPFIAPPERLDESRGFSEMASRGELVHELTLRKRKDDTQVEVELFSIPVVSRGKQIGILALYHDISRLVQFEEEAEYAPEAEAPESEEPLPASWVEPVTLAGMAAAARAVSESWQEAEPEIGYEVEPQAEPEAWPEAEPEPEVGYEFEPEGESEVEPEAEAASEFEPEAAAEPIAEMEPVPPFAEAPPAEIVIEPVTAAGLAAALRAYEEPDTEPLGGPGGQTAQLKKRTYKVLEIEGIGPVYAEKLAGIGIQTTEDLLMAGATRKGREDLAALSGISEKLILGWVNRADLMRIPGIGEEFSDLLELAGVDTVRELRQRNPQNLHQKMLEVNEQRKVVRRIPSLPEVTSWIQAARETETVITY